jgi:spore germination protein KC
MLCLRKIEITPAKESENLPMKNITRITSLLLTAALMATFLTGCYDRRELDTLGIVMGVALDMEKDENTEMTVQMVNVGAQGGSKKGGSKEGGSEPYINVSGKGKNMNVIIREMQNNISRKIYVAHSQIIIFGEERAKAGIRDSIDFFARAPEARMTLHIFVAKGKGAEVLKSKPEFEKLPSTELSSILVGQKLTGDAPIVTEFEFLSKIVSKTSSAVAPLVTLKEEDGAKRMKVEGCAVFKESKMVGEFNESETKGLLLVRGELKAGTLSVNALGATATMEIRNAKSKLTPEIKKDGSVKMKIEIDELVGLGDQTGVVSLTDLENSKALLDATKKETESKIEAAIDKSKKLNADVFGFGETVSGKFPKQWKELEKKWDEVYKNIEVELVVKVKGDGSGRISMPLAPKKA